MEIINHKGKYYLKTDTGYREVLATTDKSLKIQRCESSKQLTELELTLVKMNLPKYPSELQIITEANKMFAKELPSIPNDFLQAYV